VDLSDMTLGALGRLDGARLGRVLAFAHATPRVQRRQALAAGDPAASPRQREALELALASTDPVLVQGPPGTGKTWVLARLVAQLAAGGQRVLLSAFTHHAVHNALAAVLRVAPETPLAKLGHSSLAAELPGTVERLPDRKALVARMGRPGGLVVGATTHAALLTLDDRRGAGSLDFDVAVLDEASQASLPTGVATLCRARRAVLFGDHRQMPPVLQGTYGDERLTRSIFELMWRVQPGVMLDVTHRMNTGLCAFPSRAWYGGELRPSPAAAQRRLGFPASGADDPLNPDVSEVRLLRPLGEGADQRAPTEAALIAAQVARLVAGGVPAAEIAVIAPFRVQVREVRRALAALPGRAFEDVTVDTVERIQGQERDVVFLSFVVDPDAAADPAVRLFTPERLNVALTRARVKRVLVGAAGTIDAVLATAAQRLA
jgi:DNA replication ATP-dependent helicase Dna2